MGARRRGWYQARPVGAFGLIGATVLLYSLPWRVLQDALAHFGAWFLLAFGIGLLAGRWWAILLAPLPAALALVQYWSRWGWAAPSHGLAYFMGITTFYGALALAFGAIAGWRRPPERRP